MECFGLIRGDASVEGVDCGRKEIGHVSPALYSRVGGKVRRTGEPLL